MAKILNFTWIASFWMHYHISLVKVVDLFIFCLRVMPTWNFDVFTVWQQRSDRVSPFLGDYLNVGLWYILSYLEITIQFKKKTRHHALFSFEYFWRCLNSIYVLYSTYSFGFDLSCLHTCIYFWHFDIDTNKKILECLSTVCNR